MTAVFRNGFSRPWPEGEPTRAGERCEMSDLLVNECACRKHKKENDGLSGSATASRPAREEEFDFRGWND